MSENFTAAELDTITAAYTNALLWSEVDEDGDPMDSTYDASDIDADSRERIRNTVEAFVSANADDLREALNNDNYGYGPGDVAQIGHDFALTRNRHGAGFWDRGLGAVGETLTEAAQKMGETSLYTENGIVSLDY